MQHITTAEQQHILGHIGQSKEATKVKYIDSTMAINTLLILCKADLEAGKSIGIKCADISLQKELLIRLAEIKLLDYTLLADSPLPIEDYKIATLRSNFKSDNLPEVDTAAKFHYKFAIEDLTAHYQTLRTTVHQEATVTDLPHIIGRKNNGNSKSEALDITNIRAYSPNMSHHQLLGFIKEMAQQYQPLFFELAKSEILTAETMATFEGHQKLETVRLQLTEYLHQAKGILSKYESIGKQYKDKHFQNIDRIVADSKDYLRNCLMQTAHEQVGGSKESNGLLGGIFKKKNVPTENLSAEVIAANLKGISKKWISVLEVTTYSEGSSLGSYLYALLGKLPVIADPQNHDPAEKAIKHLSLLNQQDEYWKITADSLLTFTKAINESNILSSKYEINSKALQQQTKLIKDIVNHLSQAVYRLEHHSDYYMYSSQNMANQLRSVIVETFKHYPSEEWRALYDRTFFSTLADEAAGNNLPKDTSLISNTYTKCKTAEQATHGIIAVNLGQAQKTTLLEMKKSEKQLFQSLIKKKLPMTSTAQELTTHFGELSKKLFGIHIYDQSSLSYDVTYAIGTASKANNLRATFVPFVEEDFKQMEAEKDYLPLYLNHYQYTETIAKLNNTDKIKAAKKLAKLLLSSCPQVKIYQLKTANIISVLQPQDDQLLELSLHNHSAKTMHLDDVYLQLVESILATDRKQYLIIKDGTLRPDQTATLMFQYDVLNKFNSAGIAVQSVYTSDQLIASALGSIEQLVSGIVPTVEIEEIKISSSSFVDEMEEIPVKVE